MEWYRKNRIPKDRQEEAAQSFGPQSNFTPDEQQIYRAALMRKAEDTGINLFDLL